MREVTAANRALLAKLGEIVEADVIQPMTNAGWNEDQRIQQALAGLPGVPAPEAPTQGDSMPPQSGPPAPGSAPTQPAPGPTQPFDLTTFLESLRDPQSGLILRKYKDVPAAVQGVQHAVSMAHDALNQRDAAFKKVEELTFQLLEKTPATAPTSPSQPSNTTPTVDTAALDAVMSKILEDGGFFTADTANAMREAVVKTIATAVPTGPVADPNEVLWDNAFTEMEKSVPDFRNHLDSIGLFLRSNEVVRDAVDALVAQKKFLQATKLAYDNMVRLAPAPITPAERAAIEANARTTVHTEVVDAARKDAGVITTNAGGAHESAPSGPSQEQIDRAAAIYHRTTDGRAWRELALGPMLNSPLFD